ncbi:hypothetical protein Hanom_Chr09g00783371 [Helianthus anomalus]
MVRLNRKGLRIHEECVYLCLNMWIYSVGDAEIHHVDIALTKIVNTCLNNEVNIYIYFS